MKYFLSWTVPDCYGELDDKAEFDGLQSALNYMNDNPEARTKRIYTLIAGEVVPIKQVVSIVVYEVDRG